MKRPLIVRFQPSTTAKQVYDVAIKDLRDAIKVGWNDEIRLARIEDELRDCLAGVQNQRYKLKQTDWQKRQLPREQQ